MYPTKIEANGNIYEINTDYRVALSCFEVLDDEEITDVERFYAIESLLLGINVDSKDDKVLNEKIALYLRCGREKNTDKSEIDMDYIQDEKYIRTSIKQVYSGLDIGKIDYMHWWEYNELIEGLTTESILNKIREIRSYDESEIKDVKDRSKLLKAKKSVALKSKIKVNNKQNESAEKFMKLTGLKRKG